MGDVAASAKVPVGQHDVVVEPCDVNDEPAGPDIDDVAGLPVGELHRSPVDGVLGGVTAQHHALTAPTVPVQERINLAQHPGGQGAGGSK